MAVDDNSCINTTVRRSDFPSGREKLQVFTWVIRKWPCSDTRRPAPW